MFTPCGEKTRRHCPQGEKNSIPRLMRETWLHFSPLECYHGFALTPSNAIVASLSIQARNDWLRLTNLQSQRFRDTGLSEAVSLVEYIPLKRPDDFYGITVCRLRKNNIPWSPIHLLLCTWLSPLRPYHLSVLCNPASKYALLNRDGAERNPIEATESSAGLGLVNSHA